VVATGKIVDWMASVVVSGRAAVSETIEVKPASHYIALAMGRVTLSVTFTRLKSCGKQIKQSFTCKNAAF